MLATEALGATALHAEGDATQLAMQYLLPIAWLTGGEGNEGGEGGEGEGGEGGGGGGGYAERWARSKAQHSLQQDPVGKAQQDQDATGRVAHRERAVHTAREGRQQVPRAIGRLKKVRSTYHGHTDYPPMIAMSGPIYYLLMAMITAGPPRRLRRHSAAPLAVSLQGVGAQGEVTAQMHVNASMCMHAYLHIYVLHS